jgi:5-methylcytosine-specific restriction endonuclease McrA
MSFKVTADNKPNLYCSRECYEKFRATRVEVICKFCGKSKLKTPSRAKVSSYCNKTCKYAHLATIRTEMVGPKNPNFIDGRSGIVHEYRKKALKVQEYKCAVCERTNLKLYIHHIDCNRANNSLQNLIILCAACHVKIHNMIHSSKPVLL